MTTGSEIRAHLAAAQGKLGVSVWHPTLGFSPAFQPALVGIRLQVPSSGPYSIDALANHGGVGVRRLTLAHIRLRGLRPGCNCSLNARTEGGEIRLSFTPDPDTGLEVTARSGRGPVRVDLPGPEPPEPMPARSGTEEHVRTKDYEKKPIRFHSTLTTETGGITVVSVMDFPPSRGRQGSRP